MRFGLDMPSTTQGGEPAENESGWDGGKGLDLGIHFKVICLEGRFLWIPEWLLTTGPLGVLEARTEWLERARIRELDKYLGRQVWLFNLITHKIQKRKESLTSTENEHVAGVERMETPVQKLEFPAWGEIYQRQEEEDWEKEIRLAGTNSYQVTGIQV